VKTIVYSALWRLLTAGIAVIASLALYLPSDAHANAFHDFYGHLVHPWGSVAASWCILGLCIIALSLTGSVLHVGSWAQRFSAVCVSVFPLIILSRYLVWLMHQWTAG
jgi:hypothetical protein